MALFGWGGSLEDKITYNKGMLAYPSTVIAMKSLLVADRPHHSSVLLFFEHVNIHLALFIRSLLVIEVDAWGVEVEAGGDDRLRPVDEEEGCVPHRTIHTCPQAPE